MQNDEAPKDLKVITLGRQAYVAPADLPVAAPAEGQDELLIKMFAGYADQAVLGEIDGAIVLAFNTDGTPLISMRMLPKNGQIAESLRFNGLTVLLQHLLADFARPDYEPD